MRLTQKASRLYQYTVLFFSTIALILFNHPTIFLASIFIILTLTLYTLKGIWEIKKLNGGSFEASMSVTPNVLTIGDKSRIRTYLESKLDDKLKVEVHVPLSEGLRLDSGEAGWSGILGSRDSVIFEFTIRVEKPGLLEVGPLQVVAMDDLELVCKIIDLEVSGIMYSFEEPVIFRGVATSPLPVGFNYPGYTLHPFIGVAEEYRESVQGYGISLRGIDWRRTARTEGEEVYIKEYSKRRATDIIFGLGTGLDLDIPYFGNVLNWITQTAISCALYYLREASRIWMLNYNNGKPVTAQLRLSYGELISRKGLAPSGGLLIYVSRLLEREELNLLEKYLRKRGFRVNTLLIDLSDVVSKIVDETVLDYESERLRRVASRIQGPVEIVEIRDFANSLKRSLASR